jgi:hypothetical protein
LPGAGSRGGLVTKLWKNRGAFEKTTGPTNQREYLPNSLVSGARVVFSDASLKNRKNRQNRC